MIRKIRQHSFKAAGVVILLAAIYWGLFASDRYVSEALGEQMSLTLRFVLQSDDKTLEEEDITMAMESILNGLRDELGVSLR